ncbi:T5orf172 domain-containing protein [Litoreibacter ascidiaceicola]|uniref:T5orf172 domain-containing protein n=1 Tax=Litoreibacter ascidiaceicola TaxID=1486859 RepID=A0A1M4YEQ5_9RHOB|nr:GIY-YIG nuclease family protein [Litoreibacter ascidiaceicola]SHF04291.1 T5orf172 domain-containing protein [Litoreibacter ascidiaceicola]
MKAGWIYALYSEAAPLHKIGLTTTSPAQRIREINHSVNYGPFGPWKELDVRRVRDTSKVEAALHRRLAAKKSNDIPNTRELFHLSRDEARAALDSIPDSDLSEAVPIHNLRVEPDFLEYLMLLFQNSGLENFRDIQESWTFSLFPSTNGLRFFTLNIDRHEVAFSIPLENGVHQHVLVVDKLIRRDKAFMRQLKAMGAIVRTSPYASNWGDAVLINIEATFIDASNLLDSTTFRRAILAYWYDALLRMKEKGTRSLHARHHNYDAVSEVFRHMEERKRFRAPA